MAACIFKASSLEKREQSAGWLSGKSISSKLLRTVRLSENMQALRNVRLRLKTDRALSVRSECKVATKRLSI